MPILAPATTLAAALAVTAGLLPATAGAATSCAYTGAPFDLLEVELPANGDVVQLAVPTPGGDIVVSTGPSGAALACAGGTPTVSNTNIVSVNAGGGSNRVDVATANRFAPGATPETGDDEIEIGVDFNDQPNSLLRVSADDAGVRFRAGTDGINTNADAGEGTPDSDITLVSVVERLELHGGAGSDTLDAQGGAGTGSALSQGIVLSGTLGTDAVVGGEGNDVLRGGSGTNTLFGRGGSDVLASGAGDDVLSGDGGIDQAHFGFDPDIASGVAVDLTISGFQDTGGGGSDLLGTIENVTGTPFDDVIGGDAGSNRLSGGNGNDVLDGRADDDTILGDEGVDALAVRDGAPDTADCGDEVDTVTADPLGIDVLSFCETVLFPPAPGSAGGGSQGGGTGAGGPLAFGPGTRVTLALAARRVPASGPLRVRVANQNDFTLRGRLSGRTTRPVGKRHINLRARAFSAGAGARTTVKLALPRALRRRLARKRRLSLRLNAQVTDPAGNTRSVKTTATPKLERRG